MKEISLFFIVTAYSLMAISQTKMRPAEELINKTDPGWPLVKAWIDSAKNKVEMLQADSIKSKIALFKTQVTTRSPMGAIIFMTGGLLIDSGWIRILGSGNIKLNRSLPDWNKGKAFQESVTGASFLLIADDAIGGFFLLNGGGLGKDLGKVYYFAPENLEYEPLGLSYTEFLNFCFNSDLNKFYKSYRWQNWQTDLLQLTGDKVFNFFPPLWTKEGKEINKTSRKAISVEEQYFLNMDMRKRLGLEKSSH